MSEKINETEMEIEETVADIATEIEKIGVEETKENI